MEAVKVTGPGIGRIGGVQGPIFKQIDGARKWH